MGDPVRRSSADPLLPTCTRRQVLGGAAALATGVALRAVAAQDDPAARPIELGPGPHLLLDDYLLAEQQNVSRKVNRPRRDLVVPVVTGPEDRCFQPYVTVVRDPARRRFRMWYGVPESGSQTHLAYLESPDGFRWLRPHRVLADPDTIQFGVSIIDEGPEARDPATRFKYGWWHGGGLKVAGSPDGFTWKPLAPGVVLPHNHDINSIHWDPIRKQYLAFLSNYVTGPTWKGPRRITTQSTSADLIHWKEPWPVLTPEDGKDAGETQFYCMSGVLACGDLLVGMVKVLRDDLKADHPPDPPDGYGIGYTALAWSRDGRTWTRDREVFFDRDPRKGAWDHAHAWIDCQLPFEKHVYLYYGGYARGHKVERFKERQIGLVRMLRDRYVAREAGNEPGTLRTPPFRLRGSSLALNVEARKGDVRVQVLDATGTPVPDYTFDDGVPIAADHLTAPVRWKKPLAELKDRTLRLEIRLQDARLFALHLD